MSSAHWQAISVMSPGENLWQGQMSGRGRRRALKWSLEHGRGAEYSLDFLVFWFISQSCQPSC